MFLWRLVAPGAWRALNPTAALPAVAPGEQERVAQLQRLLVQHLQRLDDASRGPPGDLSAAGTVPAGAPAAAVATNDRQPGRPLLAVAPSTIAGAGRGVFLTRGTVQAGAILTLYPGLVLSQEQFFTAMALSAPGADEAFAPVPPPFTAHNSYLLHLRCLGRTFLVDGRPAGLSAQRFAAAAACSAAPVNSSWLPGAGHDGQQQQGGATAKEPACSSGAQLLQQAALGHLLNHQPAHAATAGFELCPLPASLPPRLLRFVPALNAAGADPEQRWVPLVRALVPLAAPGTADGSSSSSGGGGSSSGCGGSNGASSGQPLELFVDYGANPCNLGYH